MTITETKETRAVFVLCRDEIGISFDADTAEELCEKLDTNTDFTMDIDGGEYRFIETGDIEGIWTDSLIELLEECYTVPDYVKPYVDYDAWAEDCKMDGMGHHFGSYDGNEYETNHWHVFRTN